MSILQALNKQLAGTVARIRPNLVQVHNGKKSGGAGVIWRRDGLIITNAHVVAPSYRRSKPVNITLPNGDTHKGRIIAFDKERDLAALTINAKNLPAIQLGNSQAVVPGDWVTAVGHPWGVIGAATSGTVIGVNPPPEIPYAGDLIQVGLHMRPGHSGGAMIDNAGRLIGINCMIAGPNIGLAIPIHTVVSFLKNANNA